MANAAKRKGDAAELEIARLLADLTGWPVERKLGAGRKEDTGDLYGVPDTTIQVKNYPADLIRSIREGVVELEVQHANAGTTFAVCFVRRRGGRWLAVMTPQQWATWAREAVPSDCDCPLHRVCHNGNHDVVAQGGYDE